MKIILIFGVYLVILPLFLEYTQTVALRLSNGISLPCTLQGIPCGSGEDSKDNKEKEQQKKEKKKKKRKKQKGGKKKKQKLLSKLKILRTSPKNKDKNKDGFV
ncbi:hypothetical protein ACR3K2_31700, partial [Cryptosporidium serpentis]